MTRHYSQPEGTTIVTIELTATFLVSSTFSSFTENSDERYLRVLQYTYICANKLFMFKNNITIGANSPNYFGGLS